MEMMASTPMADVRAEARRRRLPRAMAASTTG